MSTKEKFLSFIEKYYWQIFVGLTCLLCFCCFFRLGSNPVRLWDEARHGVSAYEMIKNKNGIANFFNGTADYWNLKPPISFWTIALGYKIFGFNAWGLRFFSAFFFVLTIVIIALFLKKNFGKLESLLSLLLSTGLWHMFMYHYVRAGDAEGIYIFFVTIALIALYYSSKNANWLYLVGLMFSLAFLTKSFHALILVPIVFFYMLFTKGFKKTKWWQLVLFFAISLIPIGVWGLFRYSFDGTRFFEAMINTDLLSRTGTTLEGNSGYPFFYIGELMCNFVLGFCLILSIINLILKLKSHEKLSNLDWIFILSFVMFFGFFGIIKTKLSWYTFPCLFPILTYGSITISKIIKCQTHQKLMRSAKILTAVIVVAGLATNITLISIKRTDKMQDFLCSISLESDSKIYVQIGDSDGLNQAELLCLEWSTDSYLSSGGRSGFEATADAFLITTEDIAQLITINFEVIYQDENYILIQNTSF